MKRMQDKKVLDKDYLRRQWQLVYNETLHRTETTDLIIDVPENATELRLEIVLPASETATNAITGGIYAWHEGNNIQLNNLWQAEQSTKLYFYSNARIEAGSLEDVWKYNITRITQDAEASKTYSERPNYCDNKWTSIKGVVLYACNRSSFERVPLPDGITVKVRCRIGGK